MRFSDRFLDFSRRRTGLALIMTLLTMAAVSIPSCGLQVDGASGLRFELAFTTERANAAVTVWNKPANTQARDAFFWWLLLDLPFIACYPIFLAGACANAAERWRARRPVLAARVEALAKVQWLAGAFDLVENAGMAFTFYGRAVGWVVGVYSLASAAKWLLVAVAVSVVAVGLVQRLVSSAR